MADDVRTWLYLDFEIKTYEIVLNINFRSLKITLSKQCNKKGRLAQILPKNQAAQLMIVKTEADQHFRQ